MNTVGRYRKTLSLTREKADTRFRYCGVVDQLQWDELLVLRDHLNQLRFTRDIIASSPEDIVLSIVVYLHSLTVAKLQLVTSPYAFPHLVRLTAKGLGIETMVQMLFISTSLPSSDDGGGSCGYKRCQVH